jgi:hypothetical protein
MCRHIILRVAMLVINTVLHLVFVCMIHDSVLSPEEVIAALILVSVSANRGITHYAEMGDLLPQMGAR